MTDRWSTPERVALRALARDVVAKEVAPHVQQWEDEGELPRSLHRTFAATGLLGVGFPEHVGGSGGDSVDTAIVTEELLLGGGSGGVVASLFTHGIALPHLVAAGGPELVDRYVRPTLAGELIGALGVTEPGGGSDVAGLRTRAVLDRDSWVVDGAKTYITSGVRADFVTTAVRTGGPGHGGISLLVVDTRTPGVGVERLAKMGWHCSDTAELTFDAVRVPVGNLVGEPGTGFRLIMQQFQAERLSLAVQASATAQRCVDLCLDWVRDRETFGKPLAGRQVVRHRLARMARLAWTARSVTRAAYEAWLDGGDGSRSSGVLEVSMAKNAACEACDEVVDLAVQLFGGLGYMRGAEVERHYRDARILRIGGGTDEIMDEVVAKLLGL